MSDFSVNVYKAAPLRCPPFEGDTFPEETKKEDDRALENMKNHQEIIGRMLTSDVDQLFMASKKNDKGGFEPCLAFSVGGRMYPFKVLIPRQGEKGDGLIMLRVAKLTRKNREHNFLRGSWIDEPSALVIIDNSTDQQRVLLESTTTWPETETLANIIKAALNEKLKAYRLMIEIEPVWNKADLFQTVRKYRDHIKSAEFDVGFPNMGRTGDKFLSPLKDSLSNVYASGTVKYSFNKSVEKQLNKETKERIKKKELPEGTRPRTTMNLDPDNPDELFEELALHCSEYGLPVRLGLDNYSTIRVGPVPEKALKSMDKEQRDYYRKQTANGQPFSMMRVSMSRKVADFDGQDDLFESTADEVHEKLADLKEINYKPTSAGE